MPTGAVFTAENIRPFLSCDYDLAERLMTLRAVRRYIRRVPVPGKPHVRCMADAVLVIDENGGECDCLFCEQTRAHLKAIKQAALDNVSNGFVTHGWMRTHG